MRHAAHTPVLLRDVIEALAPRDGGIYIDGTFGAGGYSRAILDSTRLHRLGHRSRSPGDIGRRHDVRELCRPATPEAGPLRRHARAAGVRRRCRRRRHRARYRRLLDADRPGRARLLLPLRRSARHAHGEQRPERRRSRQSCRRRRARRHHLQLRRRAPRPRDRPRHRECAQDQALLPHAGAGGDRAPRQSRPRRRRHRPGHPHLPGAAHRCE